LKSITAACNCGGDFFLTAMSLNTFTVFMPSTHQKGFFKDDESKSLQKSSAIQNIFVILSEVSKLIVFLVI
jgi:hypothetical protein